MGSRRPEVLAVPHSLITVAALAVVVAIIVLVVVSFRPGRGGRRVGVAPPPSGPRVDRKPHD
jgi:hypothetical protein